MSEAPCVGVFDSGIGGLSVLRAIHEVLPQLGLLYVADTAFAPYSGLRDPDILQRARHITEFLFRQGAEAVVVACNTATAVAIDILRGIHSRPLVGMEPAIKPALERTRTGRIGILATQITLGSERYLELARRWSDWAKILPQPCPDLVLEVERGNWDGAEIRSLLETYLSPLFARGVDTLVLGCTHYHFLKPELSRIVGAETAILDPCYPVARQLARVLALPAPSSSDALPTGSVRFWTSGDPDVFRSQLVRVWGRAGCLEQLPV